MVWFIAMLCCVCVEFAILVRPLEPAVAYDKVGFISICICRLCGRLNS